MNLIRLMHVIVILVSNHIIIFHLLYTCRILLINDKTPHKKLSGSFVWFVLQNSLKSFNDLFNAKIARFNSLILNDNAWLIWKLK